MRHATGLRSPAKASHPKRSAYKGIEPPPAKGPTTKSASPGCAAHTRERPVSKYSGLAELSQLAKAAMNFSSAHRSPSVVVTCWFQPDGRIFIPSRASLAWVLKDSGQCGLRGSGKSRVSNTAREEAKGRRAH